MAPEFRSGLFDLQNGTPREKSWTILRMCRLKIEQRRRKAGEQEWKACLDLVPYFGFYL